MEVDILYTSQYNVSWRHLFLFPITTHSLCSGIKLKKNKNKNELIELSDAASEARTGEPS
jgi:hypothetical protein